MVVNYFRSQRTFNEHRRDNNRLTFVTPECHRSGIRRHRRVPPGRQWALAILSSERKTNVGDNARTSTAKTTDKKKKKTKNQIRRGTRRRDGVVRLSPVGRTGRRVGARCGRAARRASSLRVFFYRRARNSGVVRPRDNGTGVVSFAFSAAITVRIDGKIDSVGASSSVSGRASLLLESTGRRTFRRGASTWPHAADTRWFGRARRSDGVRRHTRSLSTSPLDDPSHDNDGCETRR